MQRRQLRPAPEPSLSGRNALSTASLIFGTSSSAAGGLRAVFAAPLRTLAASLNSVPLRLTFHGVSLNRRSILATLFAGRPVEGIASLSVARAVPGLTCLTGEQ